GVAEVRFCPAFTLEPRTGGIGIPQAEARLQEFFDEHVRAHPTQWFEWDGAWPGPLEGSAGSTSR
ncbi:MAG: hypothetical protein ACRENN_07285, partial [Candidatus Eiseniibacteriota bacterium]